MILQGLPSEVSMIQLSCGLPLLASPKVSGVNDLEKGVAYIVILQDSRDATGNRLQRSARI